MGQGETPEAFPSARVEDSGEWVFQPRRALASSVLELIA